MVKTYEEKMTREIKRMLRHLDEACRDQGISMEQALEWYKDNNLLIEKSYEEENNKNLSYRGRAEKFVTKYVNGQEKNICVAALCYVYNKEECPDSKQIAEAVTSEVSIVTSNKEQISRIIAKAITDMLNNSGLCQFTRAKHWGSLKHLLFKLAKSL